MDDTQLLVAMVGMTIAILIPCVSFFIKLVKDNATQKAEREHDDEQRKLTNRRLSRIDEKLDELGNRMTRMEAKHNGGCAEKH